MSPDRGASVWIILSVVMLALVDSLLKPPVDGATR